MIDETVAHYRILEQIGGGGMGVVYKARDLRLKRLVALKFLPENLTRDPEARARFLREAQAASVLDHPHICTIHQADTTDDERLYIVMAYYEGDSLKKRLAAGALSPDEAVSIALQTARGLARAHHAGIVHRDIKPANLMITTRNEVKIVDFGLAKVAAEAELTQTGSSLGTPAYMSPEQARGDKVDHRTDLWSLGVVFYEMLTGKLPFRGEFGTAILHALLHEDPEPLQQHDEMIPAELQTVVDLTLAKDPDQRYSTADELANQLLLVRDGVTITPAPRPAPKSLDQPSVAVMPFLDLSQEQDQAYFCDGMAEELINALARVEGLHVASRTASFQYRENTQDISKIGKSLKVETILEGSVRKAGNRIRITTRLVNVSDGYEVWSNRYDRQMEDVFAVQDEIARTIAAKLTVQLVGHVDHTLIGAFTDDLDAYHAYLKGRYFWNKRTAGDLRKSAEFFNEAIEQDAEYSRAYAGLADTYATLGIYGAAPPGEVMPKAREAAQKALSIDGTLAEALVSLACVKSLHEWKWEEAEADFLQAIDLDPSYQTAHHWYAMNNLAPRGRFEDARVQLKLALELDPLSAIVRASLGIVDLFAGREAAAAETLRRALELEPNFAPAHNFLAQSYARLDDRKRALSSFNTALDLSGGSAEIRAMMGWALGRWGQADQAREQLRILEEEADSSYVPPSLMARVELGLGNEKRAFELLDAAVAERSCDLAWVAVRPEFESIREHPRFEAVCEQMFGGVPGEVT